MCLQKAWSSQKHTKVANRKKQILTLPERKSQQLVSFLLIASSWFHCETSSAETLEQKFYNFFGRTRLVIDNRALFNLKIKHKNRTIYLHCLAFQQSVAAILASHFFIFHTPHGGVYPEFKSPGCRSRRVLPLTQFHAVNRQPSFTIFSRLHSSVTKSVVNPALLAK